MNLNNAKYISTIVEEGSLTKAAEKLYISQPALSQTIKQVEDELEVKIFEKNGRNLKLTIAGERYLNAVQQMILIEHNLRDELAYLKPEKDFKINFGISVQYGRILLPKIINELRINKPNISLNITLMGSSELEKAISENKLDLAIAGNLLSFSNLNYIFLSKDILGILAGENSDLYNKFDNKDEITLRDARNSYFVSLAPGHYSRYIQDTILESNNMTIKRLTEVGNFEIAKNIAIHCGAIFITPYALVRNDLEVLKVKAKFFPLKNIAIEKVNYLIVNKERYLNEDMTDFIDLIKKLGPFMT